MPVHANLRQVPTHLSTNGQRPCHLPHLPVPGRAWKWGQWSHCRQRRGVLHRSFLLWASAKFATFGIESFPPLSRVPATTRVYLLPHQIIIRHSRQSSVRAPYPDLHTPTPDPRALLPLQPLIPRCPVAVPQPRPSTGLTGFPDLIPENNYGMEVPNIP